ncbi:MAG: phosphotransferase [Chloroflexi bacterium]|nr:phosphotransferase [Chloroflexota bacterium]
MSGSIENSFDLQPNKLAGSVEELLRGVDVAGEIDAADSRSGAKLERVEIDGEKFVLKRISWSQDWLMRTSDDTAGWTARAWESGIMSHIPDSIDHTTVGAARWASAEGADTAVLMRDVVGIVPDGDSVVPLDQHLQLIDRMAELHAHFLGFSGVEGLMPLENRLLFLSPNVAKKELEYDPTSQIPGFVIEGWKQFAEKAPELSRVVLPLLDDVSPLVKAMQETPFTFMHGDWKATNLGTSEDGRTILIDWAFPGFGPGCGELVWYLALNAARNPQSKEETISVYRNALERHGVDGAPWFDRQLELAILGVMVQFGWEKALGGGDEFKWWNKAARATRL